MPTLPGLVLLVFTICAYAASIKLAARLFRRTQLAWTHAFVFGVFVFVFGATGTLLNLASGEIISVPMWLVIGLAAQLVMAGWYLGSRATTAAGQPLGFMGAALLSLGSYVFVFFLGIAAALLEPLFARIASSVF